MANIYGEMLQIQILIFSGRILPEGNLLRAVRLASPHRPLNAVRLRVAVERGTYAYVGIICE